MKYKFFDDATIDILFVKKARGNLRFHAANSPAFYIIKEKPHLIPVKYLSHSSQYLPFLSMVWAATFDGKSQPASPGCRAGATTGIIRSVIPYVMRLIPLPPMKPLLPLLLAALLGLSQCHTHDPSPLDQLPPATQNGAGTFGCLLNGQAWIPKGFNSYSNYTVSYDPTYRKGTLNVSAYRYIGTGANDFQTIGFFSDSLRTTGIYPLTILGHQEAVFIDNVSGCQLQSRDNHYRRGALIITRLDLQAGIIAGTFAFTLYKSGCDSVRVTNGRFDYKL